MTKIAAEPLPVRERITATAFDLFYRQGYRATGINQVIAESGVAKASFYDHFPSKDELLREYVCQTSRRELEDLRRQVEAMPTASQRFFEPLRMLIPWFESSGYRGCPFQNIVAEAPPEDPRIRQAIRRHREQTRRFLGRLAQDLIAADAKLAHLDVQELADAYQLLFEGAIALAVAYRRSRPVNRAIAALEGCLKRR